MKLAAHEAMERQVGADGGWETIDVRRYVEELEHVLRAGEEPDRCTEALRILERWRFDLMLDAASRRRAADLLREFGPPSFSARGV